MILADTRTLRELRLRQPSDGVLTANIGSKCLQCFHFHALMIFTEWQRVKKTPTGGCNEPLRTAGRSSQIRRLPSVSCSNNQGYSMVE